MINENSKLKPGENMLCTEIVSDVQNNFLYTTCSAKRRASDKYYMYFIDIKM